MTRSALLRVVLILSVVTLISAGPAHAVLFDLTYDDFDDQLIGTNSIVGSGTFSYDGPAQLGGTALSALTNMTFNATVAGQTFTTADIDTDLDASGIFVFDLGGGKFGLVFTGDGGIVVGSLDLRNSGGFILSHEPSASINDPIGCCGGNGMTNLYFSAGVDPEVSFGDYTATAVPEPTTLALLGAGLVAVRARRRREIPWSHSGTPGPASRLE